MPFASGTGTQQDPYIITDVHMLQAMRDDLFAHYALGANIDAADTANWNGGEGFEPIGPFRGSLDGRGHVITGLFIDRPSQYSVGLFSTISSTGTAYDVGVHANAVTGAGSVGVLAGTNGGSVSRCYTTGQLVHGEASRVGGLVGSNTGAISDCYSTVTDITSDADFVGGLVGENSNQVVRSYSIGKPEAAFFTHGGLVGWDDYGAGTVSDSYWDTETSGLSYSSGGEGKTTAEMMQQVTYVGWDFSATWRIDEGNDYPRLRWESAPPEPQDIPGGHYTVRLLDTNRKRIAIFDRIESWRYNRRPNEATEISVTLPREGIDTALLEPDHNRAQIAYFVEIYRGTRHVVTGRISKRDIKDDTVTIQCHTEEILLESHIAPAQYGRVYDNWDLADVARHVLHGWYTLRVKDKSQWEQTIDSHQVDLNTEPGVVMLAKPGSQPYYYRDGYITLRFDRDDVPGFDSWDRIRWASDNGGDVRTTMQYRYGDDPGSMGPWSDEVEGALPDEVGIVPGTADAAIIDVRINLYNVEPRRGLVPIPTLTPYVYALELVARTTGVVAEGDIPASAEVTVAGLEVDGANALKIIRDACEQVGWEFTVRDGKLSIAKEIGKDRSASVLFRAGTNMNIETLSEGDDDLVNVLTAVGPGEGINRLQVERTHAESIARYGPRRKTQAFPTAPILAELEAQADMYLNEHALPIPSFKVQTLFPPDQEPEYGYGDYVRVADPRSGIVTKSRITEEKREWSTNGLRVTLDIGLPPVHLRRQVRPPTPPVDTRPLEPSKISVMPIIGGLRVVDATAPDPRWTSTEIHVSQNPDFEPTAETMVASSRSQSFDVTGLETGREYYVKAIRVDNLGKPTSTSDEIEGVAGMVEFENITDGRKIPRIIQGGQASNSQVIFPTATVPEGKVWLVHFTPVGSSVPTDPNNPGNKADFPYVWNRVRPSPVISHFYPHNVGEQVFGLSHPGSPPLYGMVIPEGEWHDVSIVAYSVDIDYWGTYIVMELDANQWG